MGGAVNYLPKYLRFSHDFMVFLNDVLVGTIKWGEKKKIFNCDLKLQSQDHADELTKLPQGELFDWLDRRGYTETKYEIVYRQCCVALMSDFCHFVFEALSCSRKKKLAVAYALFRKPFKDNLFYFEWMLANKEDFLARFLSGDPTKIDPAPIQPEEKLRIIDSAIKRLTYSGLYDAQTIFNLRFNKAAPEGLELCWNQATHLITTSKHIKTEPQNFNFIFQERGRDEDLWEHMYSRLPYIMAYAVDVIEAAIGHFSPIRATEAEVFCLKLQRAAGCLLWMDDCEPNGKSSSSKGLAVLLRQILGSKCHECGSRVKVSRSLLIAFYAFGSYLCGRCVSLKKRS